MMADAKKQRCPVCKQHLSEEAYPASNWGTKGEPCRECRRARQRKWIRDNPEKVRARYQRWRAKQDPTYERDRRLQYKYGITKADFAQMLDRQAHKCLGCRTGLTNSAHVDHDRATGRVRGLLCSQCNTTLGMAKEDPATLRRLTAYLDYDRTKIGVYLTGALKNPAVPTVAAALRDWGYEVIDEWHSAGPEADSCWQAYEEARGRTYSEALRGRGAQNTFLFDLAYLDLADCAVLVMPAGKSAHLELGYAVGSGKPGFILLDDEPSRYEVMPNFAAVVCANPDELLASLAVYFPKEEPNDNLRDWQASEAQRERG